MSNRNVILIGYRGTGKSAVARRLALALGWDWVDADVELELRAGKSIAAIFAEDGETAFRDLESQVVADLARRTRTILAMGGGAVLREENCAALRASGQIVWLRATPETILVRVAADASTAGRRPNLTTAGGRAEIEELLARRTPRYAACADATVDTDDRTPQQVADEIIKVLCLSPNPLEPA